MSGRTGITTGLRLQWVRRKDEITYLAHVWREFGANLVCHNMGDFHIEELCASGSQQSLFVLNPDIK